MDYPKLKAGMYARLGSKWVKITRVTYRDYDPWCPPRQEVGYDYHNGMKITHSCSHDGEKMKVITKEAFIAHERARGNTSWQF